VKIIKKSYQFKKTVTKHLSNHQGSMLSNYLPK
jgi:hypothetical protein